jgi:hypothetical protein
MIRLGLSVLSLPLLLVVAALALTCACIAYGLGSLNSTAEEAGE